MGAIVGIIAGFGALVFYYSIKLAEWFFLHYLLGAVLPKGEGISEVFVIKRTFLIPFVVALGGLISGFLIFKFAPEAEGHGTDAAIDAYHNKEGKIRPRVIFLNTIASAITIGSGGSGGVFAPGMFIGASIGVSLGIIFHYLSPALVSQYNIGAFVIVGMLALFGAAGKVPIAVTLMVVRNDG